MHRQRQAALMREATLSERFISRVGHAVVFALLYF
jgi:hypothetical protein